ncbi:MAG: Na+/H+ antiporter NhaA [Gammaproteobacteria bacterium]|nr:Na+/H+ antiporter NhaA [Gammaproteobacteria bacterium]
MSTDNKDFSLPTPENSALEKVFHKVMTPIEEFIHHESVSGLLLMACTVLALVVANTALAPLYQNILHAPVGIGFGSWQLEKSLHHWINDGLMAIFFFLVGLEIKREVMVGELSDARAAALPIFAAIGGMVVPALIYLSLSAGGNTVDGWGIPMATDIAFAVGIMTLLGSRVPKSMLTFLIALAIVDDLGAVIVIAMFYTENLDLTYLMMAFAIFGLLVLLNQGGVRSYLPYVIFGILMWFFMLKSGVHATIAGVLTALTIPALPKFSPTEFSRLAQQSILRFDAHTIPNQNIMNNENQNAVLRSLSNGITLVTSPLQRMERSLHMPVAFLIIPIFALANAGIPISVDSMGEALTSPVSLGVMAGLVLGKLLGIAGATWLAIKLGIGVLPEGANFKHVIGVGLLGGVGFTMSIFIAELAFSNSPEHLLMAKTGILIGSIVAGVAGYLWLYKVGSPRPAKA